MPSNTTALTFGLPLSVLNFIKLNSQKLTFKEKKKVNLFRQLNLPKGKSGECLWIDSLATKDSKKDLAVPNYRCSSLTDKMSI